MADRFAPVAGRLAGLAGRMLGWRPQEFWRSTPAELATILAPAPDALPAPLGRAELTRLMENEE